MAKAIEGPRCTRVPAAGPVLERRRKHVRPGNARTRRPTLNVALAGLIFLVTLIAIVVRPYRINEAWSAGIGAILMVLAGVLPPSAAASAIGAEWNLFLFFLGLMVTAAVADMAGFFDWAADLAARAASGSGRLLLLNVLLLAAVITVFLSNDAAAIILTPVVYTVVTRYRLRVMPYLFAVSFMANAASMALPISNPINVLVGDHLRAPLAIYESHLLLASLSSIALTASVFLLVYRRSTAPRFQFDAMAHVQDWVFFRMVMAGLLLLAAGYIVGSALLWPLGLVATGGAAVLVGMAVVRRRLSREHVRAHVSPALFVYIAALFVLVRGVQDAGITPALVAAAVARADDAANAVVAGLIGTAIASNLINNLPGVLVFVSGAQSGGVPTHLQTPFLFGALAGADLGPNLTPVGALSTMLWLVIVRRRGVQVSAWDFLRLGAVIAPLTLLAAAVLIATTFR